MALIDILTDIAVEIGRAATDGDKAARVYRVNKAAEEIHEANDLEEALAEDIFSFNQDAAQTITLPSYIHKVRGARYAEGRIGIKVDDMRNRYNFSWLDENETWYLKPRFKGVSPIARDIENQSVIKLTIPLAEAQEFTVVVAGETDNSNKAYETITFAVGDLEKETVGNYIRLDSVVKSRATAYDVTLLDVEDNELGKILNNELQAQYSLYQILDEERAAILPQTFSGVEINYKKKFFPMKNDQDCFLGTSRYDKAIFWKFMEHRVHDPKEAGGYQIKGQQVLSQIYENDGAGKSRKINFRPSPYYDLPYNTFKKH